MKKKAAFLAAGTLAGAFAFSAGLWSLYPENRDSIVALGRTIGIIAPLPPEAQPPLVFIRTDAGLTSGYQPAAAAQGCSADGKIVRLIYRMAITADEKREEILNHPRIQRSEQKYATLRRDMIASLVEARWQQQVQRLSSTATIEVEGTPGALAGLDFNNREAATAMQNWLKSTAAALYSQHGLKVSFEVNAATGLEILEVPQAIPACTPFPSQ